jgi:drug/metabolite transporter (DMT)-like permease
MSGIARCDPLRFTPCTFHHAGDVARDLRSTQSRPLSKTTPTRRMISIPGTTGIPAPALSAAVEIGRRVWSSAWTLLVFASLFWAGNIVIGRAVAGQVPPITLAYWRWTGAVIVAIGFAWPFLKRDWPVLRRHWGILLLLAATGVASFNTMTYVGLQYTTALNALILASAGPMIILLWAFVLFGERPGLRRMLGMMLSLLGVAIVVSQGSLATLAHLSVGAGDAWILIGIVIYALYPPLLRRRPAVHPLSLLVAVMGIGSLMMLPFYLWEIAAGTTIRGGLASYAAMAYTAVLPSFIAYLFLNRAVELIGAGRAGQSSHLIPVLGMVLAVIFLGERFRLYHVLGAAAAAAGIFLASLQSEAAQQALPGASQRPRNVPLSGAT